jgi:hypothetical protein
LPELFFIFLRFLATGDSYKTLSFTYRVGVATVSRIVREVCEAIWNRLQPLHLRVPTKEQWQQIEKGFKERWQFPNCLGSLDGMRVLIQAPANSGSTFFNYKKTFSIVLLALIDHCYRFTVVDIVSYGSNSDAGVFRKSALCQKIEDQMLGIPDDKPLSEASDQPCPQAIVGDEAFPLMNNLMRPYPGNELDYAKRIYNYRLSRARRISENGFGVLANRWRIYHRKIPLSPDNVDWVIKATVVLHNMLCVENAVSIPRLEVDAMDNDNIHDGILRPLRRRGHRPRDDAIAVREMFKSYFVSAEGAVQCQDETCFGHANEGNNNCWPVFRIS